ncbi:hypothetical protein V6N13_104555 [Hibiscus sabdariffa]
MPRSNPNFIIDFDSEIERTARRSFQERREVVLPKNNVVILPLQPQKPNDPLLHREVDDAQAESKLDEAHPDRAKLREKKRMRMKTLLRKFSQHPMLWMQMLRRQCCNEMELNRWKLLMTVKEGETNPLATVVYTRPIKVLFPTHEADDDVRAEPET